MKEYERSVTHFIGRGQYFEAKTVKGGKNIILVLKAETPSLINATSKHVYDTNIGESWVFYIHGENVKKDRYKHFYLGVSHGDLEPKCKTDIDIERLTMDAIVLEALSKGISTDEVMEDRANLTNEQRSRNLNALSLGI